MKTVDSKPPRPMGLPALSLENRFLLHSVLAQQPDTKTGLCSDFRNYKGASSSVQSTGLGVTSTELRLLPSATSHFSKAALSSPLLTASTAVKGADTRNKFLSTTTLQPTQASVSTGSTYDHGASTSSKVSTQCGIPLLTHKMEAQALADRPLAMEVMEAEYQEQQSTTQDDVEMAEVCGSMPQYALPVEDAEMEAMPPASGLPEFSQCLPDTVGNQRVKKMTLINAVCCSLVDGPNFSNAEDPTRKALEKICKEIVCLDPEFILKVALYTRQELNIRTTANFLLALAAWHQPCRPYVRRYFSAAIQLPSDWMEVPKIYQSLAPQQGKQAPLPSCLRRAMDDKFKQFTEYQLAKYTTRAHRCKKSKPKGVKFVSAETVWKEKGLTVPDELKNQRMKIDTGVAFKNSDTLAKRRSRPLSDWFPENMRPQVEPRKKWKPGRVFPCLRLVAQALIELNHKYTQDGNFLSGQPKRKAKDRKNDLSLKKLVQRLHITEPALHVQSLLGCRYPSDLQTFSRSRLPGPWDSERSGKRMKLQQPDTWERQLSLHGNIASVWEELIDTKKLPFMAMLRNLRNLLKSGVSAKHHKKVLNRLSNKESVIQSRQFPFRFLSAYKVILDLEKQLEKADDPCPPNAQILRKIFRLAAAKDPELRALKKFNWTRKCLRSVLGYPVVFQLVKQEKERLKRNREMKSKCKDEMLKMYRNALDKSILISAKHNLPPLPGRTVIFCHADSVMFEPCLKAKGFCCPSDQKGENEKFEPITIMEVALLLSLMVKETAEDVQLVFYTSKSEIDVSVTSDSILENVGSIVKQLKDWPTRYPRGSSRKRSSVTNSGKAWEYRDWQSILAEEAGEDHSWKPQLVSSSELGVPAEFLLDLVASKKQVDTLLMISHHSVDSYFMSALQLYRRQVNPESLFINLQPERSSRSEEGDKGQWRDIFLSGFSEQILRFISVRGSSRLLEHVGKIDERFNLPKPAESLDRALCVERVPHPGSTAPKLRWQSVRIFISSTFRDMHGERDLLIRSVFPELRARAARHFLSIEEIDLRWGITEEDSNSNRQLGLCLSEVARSQIFIGLLGERYGHVPQERALPKLPEFEWLQSYPPGASITELEAMQFLQHLDHNSPNRAFFYFRSASLLRSVPNKWLSDFASETSETGRRLSALKNRVSEDGRVVTSGYSGEWGGVADGKPYVKGLEQFGAKVLQDVWESIKKIYIMTEKERAPEDEEEKMQEAYCEYHHRQFCARQKLLTSAASQINEPPQRSPTGGRVLLVSAGPSQGKTVFMAALVNELNTAKKVKNQEDSSSTSEVFFHFWEAGPGAESAEKMLSRLCTLLNKHLKRESTLPVTYRGLVLEFQSLLLSVSQSLRRHHTLTLVIDGADRLLGQSGQRTSDWIPENLPRRVHLVLSLEDDSTLLSSLKKRKDVSFLTLGHLEPSDRAEIVRHNLALYGKKLDESAFNNQMRLLLIKKGSREPLYLKLVSQELRTFAVYEKVSDMIKSFPATLAPLVQHVLGSLEQEHGVETVTISLTALYISKNGLRERDLYSILTMCAALAPMNNSITWEEALRAAGGADTLPMAPFSYLMRSFRSILDFWAPSATSDSKLYLSNSHLRSAIEKRYFKKTSLAKNVHLLTAAHLWKTTDPEQSDPFRKTDADAISELPYHLVHSGCLDQLAVLLTNLHFLSAHVTLGLLPHLCEVYSLYFSSLPEDREDLLTASRDVEVYRDFIQRNCSLLTQNPSLFYQQVINEPDASSIAAQAESLLGRNDVFSPAGRQQPLYTMKWMNKPRTVRKADCKTIPIPSLPTCVSMSSTGRWAVVGTSEGSVHIMDAESGQEVNSFETSCDGISACELLTDSCLCVASFDGVMELWNLQDSSRLLRIEAHKSHITDCAVSPDRKQLVTVSLDFHLKLWDSTKGTLVGSHEFKYPVNCVTFHPEGQLIATGAWDKQIMIHKRDTWTPVSVLTGHKASIQDVSFAPSGKTLASAALDGEVRLWSWRERVLLASFPAHQGVARVSKFISNGRYLVTAGEDCKVQVWAGYLGQLHKVCGAEPLSPALSVAVNPLNTYLAVGHQNDGVKIYSVSSGSLVAQFTTPEVAVQAVTWIQDNTFAAGSDDRIVWICNVENGRAECWYTCRGHQGPVLALAHSREYLVSASEDCTVHVWLRDRLMERASLSPMSPSTVLRGHSAGITCCAFSSDGQLLVTGSKDRSLLCWDMTASTPCLCMSLPSCHRDWITGCAWTPSSMVLSCSNDCTLCLWEPRSGELLTEFLGHESAVSTVLSVDEHVVSVSRDGALKVWNLAGVELTSISAHNSQINQCAAFSANSKKDLPAVHDGSDLMVATASVDGSVKMWRPLMVEKLLTQAGHSGPITGAAAGKDLPFYLTVAEDRSLRLWQAPVRKDDDSAVRHRQAVTAIAWSPRGQLVVSGSDGGEIIIWHSGTPLETVQASEQAISNILFTSQSSFFVVSTNHEVTRWDLESLPDQDSVSVKKTYNLDVGFFVTSVGIFSPNNLLFLGTDKSNRKLLNISNHSMKSIRFKSNDLFSDIVMLNNKEISVLGNSPDPKLLLLHPGNAGVWEVSKTLLLQPWKSDDVGSWITRAQPEFGFADATGTLWVEGTRAEKKAPDSADDSDGGEKNTWEVLTWEKKQIHSGSITALHLLDGMILTASVDCSVKIWTRSNLKQVGLFQCEGAVSCLQPDPENGSEIVCGDSLGNIYFLKLQ